MSKKRMLADVLWEAANKYLQSAPGGDGELYSCPAVGAACGDFNHPPKVRDFLTSLGCDSGSTSLLHEPWKTTAKFQGIRYMWLLLAMHVAEDERITV